MPSAESVTASAQTSTAAAHEPVTSLQWMMLLAVPFLMTYRIIWVGGEGSFGLTICPFICLILPFTAISFRLTRQATPLLLLIAGYPLFVAAINPFIGGMTEEVGQFFRTYGLWVANFGLLAISATMPLRKRTNLASPAFVCLALLAIIGVVEWLIANLLGMVGEVVMFGDHQLGGTDYVLHFTGTNEVRVSGFYYEPSIFGRVAMTFAAMCVLARHRLVETAICCVAIMFVTKSPGAAVLFAVAFGSLLATGINKRWRKKFGLPAAILATAGVGYFFWDRFSEIWASDKLSSSSLRLYLPLFAIAEMLMSSPLGGALGSNSELMRASSVFVLVTEDKITNGIYEFILYSGYIGIAAVLGFLGWAIKSLRAGKWQLGLVLLFFLLGPVASSSLLSFEGNVTMIALILQYRFTTKPDEKNSSKAIA